MSQTKAQLIDNLVQPITGALGSASAPTFSFTSDPNSGLYSPGADQVALSTGGFNRLFIDSSGRLLVGTSSTTSASRAVFQGNTTSEIGLIRIATSLSTPGDGVGLGQILFTDSSHTGAAAITALRDGGTWTSGSSQPTRLVFSTTADGVSSPTERMRIAQNGVITAQGVYDFTTASAANVAVLSAGQLYRSTSSSKYKTDIEALQDQYADALLSCRPVWYRSTCEADCSQHSWWGFIAEEVAEIDPRLVHWKTVEVTYDENGAPVQTPCDPEPEGVAYDRFVPHLLNLIKRQGEAIADLQAEVAALKGA